LDNQTIRTSLWVALAVLFGGIANTSAWAVPIYQSADFSGGLNSVTSSMKTRLGQVGFNSALFNCSTCADATSVSGHLIFDSSVPVPGSGLVNVFSIAAIPTVANNLIFEFDIDGISVDFGDAGILGGPAIQYSNGSFNGIFFAENFSSPNQAMLKLNMQGPTFDLRRVSDNAILFTGRLNGLTNVQDFNPTGPGPNGVPEPGTLMLLGVAAISALAIRRRKPLRS
jgi:hypothetical protein